MRILVTGGAGFAGSALALAFKRDNPGAEIVAADNLKRRGSELNLPRLRAAGIRFEHADIRDPEDIAALGPMDLLLECSAEPSVQAGYAGSPSYLLDTNLRGTLNCLEAARRHNAIFVFLSTSRVYPITPLRDLPLEAGEKRLILHPGAEGTGWSEHGIAEDFPLDGHRSLYGATKLASEQFIEEYRAAFGLRAIINRCGVLAGPWQMGRVDQGFMVLWAARHLYGGSLSYNGFGGHGHQVRDVLHVADLYDLIARQLDNLPRAVQGLWNAGGGSGTSTSLRELTEACESRTGQSLQVGARPDTNPADIPWFVTDARRAMTTFDWAPKRALDDLLDEIFEWLNAERDALAPILS
ncbi:NAD-dependent epimerase/dehydratase family protein [Nisaea acidiphila]|uniref:NAD-dependent epimerase/dehydratase family protein n=1 Tax=Nisaea acidiphila TaxID=1862145 RepID=A0A9J7AVJ0_9PROT|nr:NAD-dependent epimerase/dehydratase family protein [Nisaea acidiphila]UUX50818.1 NAD-dependent epimerase/dehydratase family protein [Nisaea acidiphila]